MKSISETFVRRDTGSMSIDAVTFEVLRNHFEYCCKRMTKILQKTAFSPILSDIMDFSNAVYDADAQLIAQAPACPIHMAAMHFSAEAALKHFPKETLSEGDVIALNDPYEGGTHIPDITFVMPIFWEGEIIGFAMNRGHWQDFGGGAAGGQSFGTHIATEGLRIPPVKIFSKYVINRDVQAIIKSNTRLPEYVDGDIQAHLGALQAAENEFHRAVMRYGVETVRNGMRELLNYTERVCRANISQIPDGVYCAQEFFDTDGVATDDVKINLAMTVDGDRIIVDLTGTDPQVAGAINSPLANTHSAILLALCFFICPDAPANGGFFRTVDIKLPDDCWLNAKWPAPTIGATNVTAAKITAAVWQAIGKAMPEHSVGIPGADTNWFVCTLQGKDASQVDIFSDVPACGWGGTPQHDGNSALFDPTGNCMNLPAEAAEFFFPVMYEEFELREDSAGAGYHRGGLGVRQKIRLLRCGEFSIAIGNTRRASPGMQGGMSPVLQRLVHEQDNGATVKIFGGTDARGEWLRPMQSGYRFLEGDAIVIECTGGGGWGNPMDRPINQVLKDVANGYVSREGARNSYGVVIEADRRTVNEQETERLRANS